MTDIGRHAFRLDREERRPVLHAWCDKLPTRGRMGAVAGWKRVRASRQRLVEADRARVLGLD